MRLLKLDDWSWPTQAILLFAQMKANDAAHAMTSAAHVSWILLQMQPVRAMIGDEAKLRAIDIASEKALLMTPRAGAKVALLSLVLETLLGGEGERTTKAFLTTAITGVPALGNVPLEIAPHIDAIAALLDKPDVATVFRTPGSPECTKLMPYLQLAHALATERKHRDVTTRHILAGGARTCEKMLAKHELPGIEDTVTKMDHLLDAVPLRSANTLRWTPRLVGAVANAFTATQPVTAIVPECVRGDDAVAAAAEAITDGFARIRAKIAATKGT